MSEARPTSLAVDAGEQPWQTAPMPAANLPIELVRLDAAGDTFAILARFPAGFSRPVAGSYPVAEEFVVLRGALDVEGVTAEPGTLCFIPADHMRSPMRSPDGCTVLAWFAGPPRFRPAADDTASPAGAVAMVAVEQATTRLLRTTEATWEIADPAAIDATVPVDVVDLGWTRWARLGVDQRVELPAGPVLARIPLDPDRS